MARVDHLRDLSIEWFASCFLPSMPSAEISQLPEAAPSPAKTARIWLVSIQGFVGFTGLLGAWGLLSDPSGANLGFSTTVLADSPFTDFFIPGLTLLLPIGLASLGGAWLSWLSHRRAGHAAVVLGLFLALFIAVEVWWVGLTFWLQPLYFMIGVIELGLGLSVSETLAPAHWRATAAERAKALPGDAYFSDRSPAYLVMTRAVSIAAPPHIVWPWLAQLGRGAGWYSVDRLDNGGRTSARHIVSWVPPPQIGDASAVGYLRDVTPGTALTWWLPGTHFLGAAVRLAMDIALAPEDGGSRLVIRMSADARGWMRWVSLRVYQLIDTLMATRQLLNVKERAETFGARRDDPDRPESGERDQYQLYEVVYASGGHGGRVGQELAARWYQAGERTLKAGHGDASA